MSICRPGARRGTRRGSRAASPSSAAGMPWIISWVDCGFMSMRLKTRPMQGSSVERRVHTTSRARGHIQENTTRLCYPTTKQMIILCSHTTDPESGVALKSPVRINGVLPAKRCDASAKSHRKWVRLHADPYRRLQESKSNRFSQSKAKIKDCIKILF